jgi:hypothetical protein
LETFWRTWNTESFIGPRRAGASLLSPEDALAAWPIDVDREPKILLPIMHDDCTTWAMELATDDHPGSRVLCIDYRDHVRALAIGVSHLVDLMSDAMAAGIAAGFDAGSRQFPWLPGPETRAQLASTVNQAGTSFTDKLHWPAHWLQAQGITTADLELKGRSHSIWDFDLAREQQPEIRGTLRGTFRVQVGGGSLNGDLGQLRDDSGTIQVLVPFGALILGELNGPVEMDVVARPQLGDDAESVAQPSACDVTEAAHADPGIDRMMHDIFNAVADLDISVVATAVRPVG